MDRQKDGQTDGRHDIIRPIFNGRIKISKLFSSSVDMHKMSLLFLLVIKELLHCFSICIANIGNNLHCFILKNIENCKENSKGLRSYKKFKS